MKKSILITGSTDGIGKLVALQLAKEDQVVYLHGRNSEKLSAVVSEVKNTSGNKNVKGFVADFSDLGAVRKMADLILQEIPYLDVLINNAGVYKSSVSKTKDNLDIRFAVNYFAPYILTNKLLPLLKKGNDPRIINLSSAAQAPVSFEAMSGEIPLTEMEAYAQSKLALTMWSMYLAAEEPDLNVIPVNPGSLLDTKMVKEGWGFHRSSADKGRDILYDLAILEKYKGASGKYFDNDIERFGTIHTAGSNKMAINELIEKTDELLS